MKFLTIVSESATQAFSELKGHKMRTFLSLLGIMIGIFCIIAVQAAVDSLEDNIKGSFDKLGNDVLYIDQRPWSEDGDVNWWKYFRRPKPSYKDFEAIQQKSKLAEISAYSVFIGNNITKFRNNSQEGTFTIGVTADYAKMFSLNLDDGRFFTNGEAKNGSNTIVLGNEVATNLFGSVNPIGKIISLGSKKMLVIGVIEKSGQSLINPLNFDRGALIPYKTAQHFINLNSWEAFSSINSKAKKGVSLEDFKSEITQILRSERRIKPSEDDNFSLNELSLLDKFLDSFFGVMKIAGLIIGGFSILVGIFSVANIMFVSVKERTNLIGIKKAIGATRNVILMEFLIESVVLCILGGILGLLLVFGVLELLSTLSSFKMYLSVSNIMTGVILSTVIGVLAGVIPAYQAAKMDPVEAIRK